MRKRKSSTPVKETENKEDEEDKDKDMENGKKFWLSNNNLPVAKFSFGNVNHLMEEFKQPEEVIIKTEEIKEVKEIVDILIGGSKKTLASKKSSLFDGLNPIKKASLKEDEEFTQTNRKKTWVFSENDTNIGSRNDLNESSESSNISDISLTHQIPHEYSTLSAALSISEVSNSQISQENSKLSSFQSKISQDSVQTSAKKKKVCKNIRGAILLKAKELSICKKSRKHLWDT